MPRILPLCLLLLGCETASVSRPTVIGLAVEVTQDDYDRMNDTAIAHEDFVAHWSKFTEWAKTAGVATETQPRERGFGYVLLDPGGHRMEIQGVETDADLIAEVCAFFSTPEVQRACQSRGGR